MCGRCACTREPGEVRRACAYRAKGSKKVVKPAWVSCSSQRYYPSYNISPQTNTPVLLSSHHAHLKHSTTVATDATEVPACEGKPPEGARVIQTMKWGLIPSWHQGEPKSFPTLLNNCRSEGMMEKASFRNAVQRGQRCIVLADGFFEWDRKDRGRKQPHFIYFADSSPTKEMVELSTSEASEREDGAGGSEPVEVKGRMLTMAGLFDVWRPAPDEEPLFTYTVITVDAHPSFGHIHHRMPAVLSGEEALGAWLNPALSTREVMKLVQPYGGLKWHPVSAVVNNARNKSPECVMEIDLVKQVSRKQNTLLNWFSKSPKKSQQQQQQTADGPSAGGSGATKGAILASAVKGEQEETDGLSPTKKPKLLSEP